MRFVGVVPLIASGQLCTAIIYGVSIDRLMFLCSLGELASASPTGIHSATQARCRQIKFSANGKQCLNFLCHSRGQPQLQLSPRCVV
jgi:hypothetical protein